MSEKPLTPIFLISLPRSGSTLLHKLMATSPDIATTSEPWIALPVAYMRRRHGILTEYWQDSCADALDDVAAHSKGGEQGFREAQARFIREIYANLSAGCEARYFLDKTPRYYLIADFLKEAFPDARFIYLFRNPLDVMSSILKSWHKDTFSPHLRSNDVDLWSGPELLAQAYLRDRDRGVRVDYEELVTEPGAVLDRLAAFLDLRLPADTLDSFSDIDFSGRMGDPAGGRRYDGIAANSVGRWTDAVSNPYRRAFLRSYIRALPNEVLEAFHIDREELLATLANAPVGTKGLLRDLAGINWYRLSRWLHRAHLHPGLWPLPSIRTPPIQHG